MTGITATIGGLIFSVSNSDSTLASMQGWYSGAPKRIEDDPNPNSDGSSPVDRDYRASRVITLTGLLNAVDVDTAITDVWTAFAGLQSDGVPSQFVVIDGSGIKSSVVSVVVNDVEPIVGGLAQFMLQLLARDPVKYGNASVLPTGLPTSGGGLQYNLGSPSGALYYGASGDLGRVTMTNTGTAPSWPTLVVTGQLDAGFYVQRLDTGQIVRYDRIVPAGSTVSIDFRTGEVLIDGLSDGSTYLTGFDFWSVEPGASFEVQFNSIGASSGTPTATFTIADGYW
jgi:hypothetical protein